MGKYIDYNEYEELLDDIYYSKYYFKLSMENIKSYTQSMITGEEIQFKKQENPLKNKLILVNNNLLKDSVISIQQQLKDVYFLYKKENDPFSFLSLENPEDKLSENGLFLILFDKNIDNTKIRISKVNNGYKITFYLLNKIFSFENNNFYLNMNNMILQSKDTSKNYEMTMFPFFSKNKLIFFDGLSVINTELKKELELKVNISLLNNNNFYFENNALSDSKINKAFNIFKSNLKDASDLYLYLLINSKNCDFYTILNKVYQDNLINMESIKKCNNNNVLWFNDLIKDLNLSLKAKEYFSNIVLKNWINRSQEIMSFMMNKNLLTTLNKESNHKIKVNKI